MKISRMEDEKYIIIGITDVDAEMRETMSSKVIECQTEIMTEPTKKYTNIS